MCYEHSIYTGNCLEGGGGILTVLRGAWFPSTCNGGKLTFYSATKEEARVESIEGGEGRGHSTSQRNEVGGAVVSGSNERMREAGT